MDILRLWPLLTDTIDCIDQSITVHALYINSVISETIAFILSLHPISFNVKPPHVLQVVTGAYLNTMPLHA